MRNRCGYPIAKITLVTLTYDSPAVHDASWSASHDAIRECRAVEAGNAGGFPVVRSRSRSADEAELEWKRAVSLVGWRRRPEPLLEQRRDTRATLVGATTGSGTERTDS